MTVSVLRRDSYAGTLSAVAEPDDPLDEFTIDPVLLAGAWADSTRVHRGRSQFTIDFVRLVPDPRGRMLVARAIVSPPGALDLRDQLDAAWADYNRWSMAGEGS